MRRPQPRFIPDLVPIILESNDNWWPRDLLRLTLVSSAWVGPVRRRLYVHPSLRSFSACFLFARSLRENPNLIQLLRGIDLRPTPEHPCAVGVAMSSLRYILSLDGLTKLTLGGELAVQAGRFLHSLDHPEAVVELHIDGDLDKGVYSYISSKKQASLEWDEVMAFKFPNLRKLKLSNLELDVVPPSQISLAYELKITDLVLDNVVIVNGYLHHLLNQSWSSVRHLFVIARNASEIAAHLILTLSFCGPTVETLYYEIGHRPRSRECIFHDDFPVCLSLRQLELIGVEIDHEALLTIGQLCQNLEQLSIVGRVSRVTPDQWASFIRSGALPSLRHLVMPGGTDSSPFRLWSESTRKPMLEAVAERDIQLSYPSPPYARTRSCMPSLHHFLPKAH